METLTRLAGLVLLGTLLCGTTCYAEDAATRAPETVPRVPPNLFPDSIEQPVLPLTGEVRPSKKTAAENGCGLLLLESVAAGIGNVIPSQYSSPCWRAFPGSFYRNCLDESKTGMIGPVNGTTANPNR